MRPTPASGPGLEGPSVAVFSAARALLALQDYPGTDEEREERLRLVLDQLALAYDLSEDLSTDQDFPEPAHSDYEFLYALFGRAFPRLGYAYYNCVLNLLKPTADPELSLGDALDDLTDIALEMEEVLNRSALSTEGAISHFRDSYYHWGQHLRNLQLFLFELTTQS